MENESTYLPLNFFDMSLPNDDMPMPYDPPVNPEYLVNLTGDFADDWRA
jgi:hypothetical protein